MAKNPETLFKEKVINDLKKLPNTWFSKIQQVTIRGVPDILACVGGVFVAIELKTEDGELSPLQEHTLNQIRKAGGVAIVSTPRTWKRDLDMLDLLI